MQLREENEKFDTICKEAYDEKTAEPYTWTELADKIVWPHLLYIVIFHSGFIITLCTYAFGLHSVPVKWWTIAWIFIVGYATVLGVVAGTHRMWSHRAYKANLPMRIFMMILYTAMGLYSLFDWIKDHQIHHKYTETDADPHNPKRGFFFAHVGWFIIERHPECIRRGREVDISFAKADPVVTFQKKYEWGLKLLFCFIIPIVIPVIFWEETILNAILTQWFIRYVLFLNFHFAINSVGHRWGVRPYNRLINPADSLILSILMMGEGSHNYHHTFPWDYKGSELPYANFNLVTLFIDGMAKLGWAYDLREPSPDLVERVVRRIGHKSNVKEIY